MVARAEPSVFLPVRGVFCTVHGVGGNQMKRHAPEKVSRARQRLGALWEEAGRLLEVFRRDGTVKPGTVRPILPECRNVGWRYAE